MRYEITFCEVAVPAAFQGDTWTQGDSLKIFAGRNSDSIVFLCSVDGPADGWVIIGHKNNLCYRRRGEGSSKAYCCNGKKKMLYEKSHREIG